MVEFYLDGVLLGPAVTEPPYTFLWDSTRASTAVHALTAKAYDYNGHSATSVPLTVDTRDTTPPTVSITYPLPNAVLDGVVPIRADVVDTGGTIVRVELLEGGVLLETKTAEPYEFTWSTVGATSGAHPLEVRAIDVGGGVGTASVEVVVAPTGAVHDLARGAPACAEEGVRCHSSALLDGRGELGPEANAPNVLGGSCLDGALGTYHVDESIDFISVRSLAGVDMVAGAQVELTVNAWLFSPAEDQVELFYAADARNPVWVALPSPVATASGAQTFTTTYALPDGDLQAVRASVRYAPAETGACVFGDYNDTDDLIFKVVAASDAIPPTVAIDSPTAATPVSGLVTISASAADATGIASVEFFVDGAIAGTDYSAPYTWSWDTATLAGGSFTLTARAVDSAGNSQMSVPVTVAVKGQVALTAPLAAETVRGTVTFAATAFDYDGVTRVEFRVGTDTVATATGVPFQASWNSASVADGIRTVVARAFDPAGNVTESASISILVSNLDNASWDNGLRVPTCSAAASKCFTGALLDGRGPLGPEADAPNTLGATCADGTQGSYHVDESIDAITIRSSGTFTVSDTVAVEVKIWASQAYLMDALDLYGAPDATATSPAWQLIATLTPARAGAQVLSAPYVLPAGALQAVRAQLRFGGEAAFVCGGGTFDDRDDVVFAVGQ